MKKSVRNTIFAIISFIILSIIFIITFKVIYQTENPSLFEIDFDKKDHIISSYGTLIGVILTFLSIIFVLFTIIQQKEQFDEEKKIVQLKEKQALFDRLKLINNLITEIISHIEDTGYEMKEFYNPEIENPLDNNQMNFYTNKNYYRLLELDYLSIYNSFQEYIKETDKTKSFNNLYKTIDFYSEIISELKSKYQYHIKDKYLRKSKIANQLNTLMNNASQIINEYQQEYKEGNRYNEQDWYVILNNLIGEYYGKISEEDETDFETLNLIVLYPFLQGANEIRKRIGFEKNTQDIVLQISNIRKQLYAIKMEGKHYGNHIKDYYKKYFSKECESYKGLLKLKKIIEKSIEDPVGNKV